MQKKKAKKVLCVFPGDCLKTFYSKGEVKQRYYNPQNFFDEVHFITFCDRDVEPDKVKGIAGNAKVFVHAVGKLKPWSIWTDAGRIASVVQKTNPGAIRAYSTSAQGFMAAFAAKKLGIPFVVSLHTNPEMDGRRLSFKLGWWKNWLSFEYNGLFTEKFVLRTARKVVCVYKFAEQYALGKGVPREKTEVIYNKVYAKNYESVKPALKLSKPAVLFVGRLIPGKSPESLIRALPSLDVFLVMVGDGPLKEEMLQLSEQLGVRNKIIHCPSIPNKDLPTYFKSAKVFALPIDYGGVAIPVIEAMAAGVPVVVSKPLLGSEAELSQDVGLVVKNNPQAFANAIGRLLADRKLYGKLKRKGLEKFSELDGSKMELREAQLYERILNDGEKAK